MRNFLLLVLTIGFFVIMSAQAQDKGGRWQFENNGFDTADWDNLEDSGTLLADATYSSEEPAEGDSYLWLDTLYTKNYFRIDDSADLDFADEDIGISAWIYPVIINDVHYFVIKGDQYSEPITTNYSLRISKSKHLEFLVRNSVGAKKVSSSFTIPVNKWTFVAAFYDYDAAKVYMWNSAISTPIDTLDFNISYFSNDDPLSIGSWYRSDPGNPSIKDFKGRIDDVRISGSIGNIIPETTNIDHLKGPSEFNLKQNYPNPFNPTTNIEFQNPNSKFTTLKVYNILGKEVATLISDKLRAGRHTYHFDGSKLASGVYYYQLRAGAGFIQTKKLILLK